MIVRSSINFRMKGGRLSVMKLLRGPGRLGWFRRVGSQHVEKSRTATRYSPKAQAHQREVVGPIPAAIRSRFDPFKPSNALRENMCHGGAFVERQNSCIDLGLKARPVMPNVRPA